MKRLLDIKATHALWNSDGKGQLMFFDLYLDNQLDYPNYNKVPFKCFNVNGNNVLISLNYIHDFKDARSVSLYPYNRSQICQNVKHTK